MIAIVKVVYINILVRVHCIKLEFLLCNYRKLSLRVDTRLLMFLINEKLGPPLVIETVKKGFKDFFGTLFVVYVSILT